MMRIDVEQENKYSLFNGLECRIISSKRDDNLFEVYVPTMDIYILLYENEIDSDL